MKKLPTAQSQIIRETSSLAATLGFMALACSMLVAQGTIRIIMKNF